MNSIITITHLCAYFGMHSEISSLPQFQIYKRGGCSRGKTKEGRMHVMCMNDYVTKPWGKSVISATKALSEVLSRCVDVLALRRLCDLVLFT